MIVARSRVRGQARIPDRGRCGAHPILTLYDWRGLLDPVPIWQVPLVALAKFQTKIKRRWPYEPPDPDPRRGHSSIFGSLHNTIALRSRPIRMYLDRQKSRRLTVPQKRCSASNQNMKSMCLEPGLSHLPLFVENSINRSLNNEIRKQIGSGHGIGVGIAMAWLVGCAPTTHVTETTTTREYDTTNPPVMAPAVNSNTTTTTQYDNGAVQRTYTQPAPYTAPDQSTTTTTQYNNGTVQRTYTQPAPYTTPDQSTTTVTTDTNDGTVQKKTTTTYSTP